MPDIRDYFRPTGSSKASGKVEKESKGSGKRRTIVIDDDDDDDDDDVKVIESPPKRRRATTKPAKLTSHGKELNDEGVSAFFNKNKKSAPKKKVKDEDDAFIVDDGDDGLEEDDDDIEMLDDDKDEDFEIEETLPVKETPKVSRGRRSRAEPAAAVAPKVSPKKEPKSTPKKAPAQRTKKTLLSSIDGPNAEEVLAQIPDAELPEVTDDDVQKVKSSFFAIKAEKGNAAPIGGDMEVDIPEAAANCLAGLTFVFTGILPRLPRDQCKTIVERYGGKVVSSISNATSCVVLGAEAGPKKILTIKEKNLKCIDEEGFLRLLELMPENGGSGERAQKAMVKKAKEEEKVQDVVLEMEKEQKVREKVRAAAGRSRSPNKYRNQEINPDEQLWTVKYAPTELKHMCGNKGPIEKLNRWLLNWHRNAKQGFKVAGPDGSGIFRAAIIHGPPGIGKTTAAHLIANIQGYDVIESNASDSRSKGLLASGVGKSLDNQSLSGFMYTDDLAPEKKKRKICLIMDEVDGMSGGDRGGVGQMAAICRSTNVPLILICNERSLPKMRPFDRVTFDLGFRRPDANAIRSRIMSICHREGLKVDAQVIDQLVQSSRSDIRQIINIVSTFARSKQSMDFETSREVGKAWEKNTMLKPFDIAARLLSAETFVPNRVSLNDKIELYFHDYDKAPLMIQENYLGTIPSSRISGSHLDLVIKASESISDGDLVDRMVRGQQQWNLLPVHAVFSSVRPGYFTAGRMNGRLNFTQVLGNVSKTGKYYRCLQEIQSHARTRISGDRQELRLQYLPLLTEKLLEPFIKHGTGGVDNVIQVMDDYFVTKEDWDIIMELGVGKNGSETRAKVLPTAVKSGFTRKYNSLDHPVPYMKGGDSLSAFPSKKAEVPDIEDVIEPEVEDNDVPEEENKKNEENDADFSKDKYVKVGGSKGKGKAAAKPRAPAKGKAKAKAK